MVSPILSPSDEELAAKARQGDHAAFSALVRMHADRFYRAAYRLLRNGHEAEEIVQNAYLKFWSDPEKFDPSRKVKWSTWFYRIVVNACLDRLRKRGREIFSDAPEPRDVNDVSAEIHMETEEKNLALKAALRTLPERQRAALQLCFWEGLSNQEAADVLGMRLKALQSLIVRAKQNLKAVLQPEWGLNPT